jgi:hypothetical protein
MSPRPYWKGYLKLSLVSCPIAGWRVVASASHSRRPKDSNLRSYCAVLLRRPRRREPGW